MKNKNILKKEVSPQLIALIFGVLVICFGLAFYALGWTGPSQSPPEGNVPPPLNVSSVGQEKVGGLIIATGNGIVNGLIVDKGNVGIGTREPSQKLDVNGYVKGGSGLCIGNDCRDKWPSIKIEQVIGYYNYLDESGIFSQLNTSQTFDNVFEVVHFTDDDISANPFPWQNTNRVYAGLRCKNENGWYLTGCGYANPCHGKSEKKCDWDTTVWRNTCITGEGELSDTRRGGVTAVCTKITLQQ